MAKFTFLDLAEAVLLQAATPLSSDEIWEFAQKNALHTQLSSLGKTPWATIGARLYMDSKEANTKFDRIGKRPVKFALKGVVASSDVSKVAAVIAPAKVAFKERQLHPFLTYFANTYFRGVLCKTIFHEGSSKKSFSEWLHPDMVGFYLPLNDWGKEAIDLAKRSGANVLTLYSFELKRELNFTNLREAFFQAVSNSSWANEGYLVAAWQNHFGANYCARNGRESAPHFRACLERAGDLAALLTNLEPHDVLFIDEIHRLSPVVEEILYPALEDYQIDIMIGEGPAARSVKLDLPPFTLVGATTRAGMLTNPLRDRFGIVARLEFYTPEELQRIVMRSSGLLEMNLAHDGALEIAKRARGTPRIANRLLRRVRDYSDVKAQGVASREVADAALTMLDVDTQGLDVMDRKLLLTVIEKFMGGPVGVDNLAAAIGEERDTIEDVLEPYLIQQGYLQRTPRGRIATAHAYQHFGLQVNMPDNRADS